MKISSERVLTTHTGSLPRPASLTDRHDGRAVQAAVQDTVERQLAAGVDVINDGEASKASYSTYVTERLSGFGGEPVVVRRWGYEEFPEYARKQWGEAASPVRSVTAGNPSCDGPVAYQDLSLVAADIANLRAAAASTPGAAELFLSAASPGVIEMFMPNRYYPSTEDYLFALAEAMKAEYDAIYQAGLVLQLDCPDLACDWARGDRRTIGEFRTTVAQRLEALDHATRDIPGEAMRLHLCWGNYEGPHHTDIPLADIIDLVLKARPMAVSFEGANPRHEHEWQIFEDLPLPDGKILVPGVLDSTTNYIEHPMLVAQRICRYADLVGRQNVMAGTDCGFATFASFITVEPEITWAKLAAMAEGARLASARLWSHPEGGS
jgi:5-methyltetrahydropteroyltriglutamate--homocysteine methyltransferase